MSDAPLMLRAVLMLLALAASPARADNTLKGLEMDVMEPGESAAQATARIALPPPVAGPEHETGLDPEQRVRTDIVGEAAMDGVAGHPVAAPDTGQPVDVAPDEGVNTLAPGDDTAVVDPDGGTITDDGD